MSLFQLENCGKAGFGHAAGTAKLTPVRRPAGSALSREHIALVALATACVASFCRDDVGQGFHGTISADGRFVTQLSGLFASEAEATQAAQTAVDEVRQYSTGFVAQATLDGVMLYTDPGLAMEMSLWADRDIVHAAIEFDSGFYVGLLLGRGDGGRKHLLAYTAPCGSYDMAYETMSALRSRFTPRQAA